MQLSIGHLENANYVVHTYAAVCIERLLTVKVPNATGQAVLLFDKAQIKPFLQGLLVNLFRILASQQSKENDYVMKGISLPPLSYFSFSDAYIVHYSNHAGIGMFGRRNRTGCRRVCSPAERHLGHGLQKPDQSYIQSLPLRIDIRHREERMSH